MASRTLKELEGLQNSALRSEYGGKQVNKFIAELKSSTQFQFNWSELLGAAPTVLFLMGSCWLAAANPAAEKIIMTNALPKGGFKYLTNRSMPTLQTILVDVCNNGSRQALSLAGANMDALQVRTRDISAQRIDLIFKRLAEANRGPEPLEDFMDSLEDLNNEARQLAKIATSTREAFSLWAKMVCEAHSAVENQQNPTGNERSEAQAAEIASKIDKTFAVEASAAANGGVESMKAQLSKAEKRLDAAFEKVPGPWETIIPGAVTGYTQAIPTLISQALPVIMAAANPLSAALTAGSAGAETSTTSILGGIAITQAAVQDAQAAAAAVKQASDPAYAAAAEIRDLVNHLFEFLGGEKGTIDWSKFENNQGQDEQTSCAYLLATLKNRKEHTDAANTTPSQTFIKQLDALIALVSDIDETQKRQTDFKADSAKVEGWKSTARTTQLEIVKLASSAPTQGGYMSIPTGFARISPPKPDPAAQNAQLSTAIQGVQMAQNAVDLTQSNFDASVKRQQETAKGMSEVEKRLKSLQEKGKTLDEIKQVLRDGIAVLMDLVVQIGKLENLFIMLSTAIDNVVIPIAKRFQRDGSRNERSARDKFVSVDDMTKQAIYISMLQIKAYFSHLNDVTLMYSTVDRRYISQGVDLCTQISAGLARRDRTDHFTQQLVEYSARTSEDVARLITEKQSEMLAGLRDRVKTAAETSKASEDIVREAGVTIDTNAKQAIDAGKADAAKGSEAIIRGEKSAVAFVL